MLLCHRIISNENYSCQGYTNAEVVERMPGHEFVVRSPKLNQMKQTPLTYLRLNRSVFSSKGPSLGHNNTTFNLSDTE